MGQLRDRAAGTYISAFILIQHTGPGGISGQKGKTMLPIEKTTLENAAAILEKYGYTHGSRAVMEALKEPEDDGYIDPHKYFVDVDGKEVFFGFNGINEIALFGGSYFITYPENMTLEAVKQDIIDNYSDYQADQLESTYRAWGYYD